MSHLLTKRAALTAALCAAVGAVAGIAGSAAAPARHPFQSRAPHAGFLGRPPFDMHGGPPVHADEVVLNKAGTAFITATEDSGTVDSVSGSQLSIKEGLGSVTYKTVSLSIPAGATVYRNFAKAALGALKPGDHVHVSQSSDGTVVIADDGTAPPFGGRGFHGGPERFGGPAGPDPGDGPDAGGPPGGGPGAGGPTGPYGFHR